MLAVVAIVGIGVAFANPVSVNTAKMLGQKYVQANFEMNRSASLELYYTVNSDNGEPCAYVFNVGNQGFVIVAASDNVSPILGYSEEGAFDSNNPYNGAMYMLETYKNSISYAIANNIVPTPDVAAQWKSLENCGKMSNNRPISVGPLVWTKWNQNSPYNLYAPAASGGPGGRCYAGCVATAMSQVMRFWAHPAQGTGSHSYYCPGYGQQSANFGATTYQWDLMPKTLNGASQAEIEAVATLMYHCAVAVNMGFAPDGSGAYSGDVPPAMASYFDYNYCNQKQKNSYPLATWNNMLKSEFDMGHPVYYSGHSSEGGHAFVCDGYNQDNQMHFNFGWSGSDDGWYLVDAIDYNSQAAAIFNYIPTNVYNNTVQAPTNVTATKTSETAQEATITWTNPTQTLNNQTVSAYDQIVLERNGVVIQTYDNPTPGATLTFVDSNVPCYSTFEYSVYAVKAGVKGAPGRATESFGPTCQWKIIATASNMAGWKGAYLVAYDGAGTQIDRFTMTNSNNTTYNMDITLGKVSFAWQAGTESVPISFKIKDGSGTKVYEFEGNSGDCTEGVLYVGNNGCGNPAPTMTPPEIFTDRVGDDIIVTWEGTKTDYGINVYRDGLLCALVHGNQYIDEAPVVGGHCYQIAYLTDGGESVYSNEACATAGEGCDPATNEWYYLQANKKPVITWDAPAINEGLTNYYIYRKVGEDGEFQRKKILAGSATEYEEKGALENGVWYYYRVVAYYKDIDCFSAPAKAAEGNDYFVKILFTPAGVEEGAAAGFNLFPNPAKGSFTVEAENIQQVMVYNTIGQLVHSQVCEGNKAVVDLGNVETGIYMVKVLTANGETVQKVSVIK